MAFVAVAGLTLCFSNAGAQTGSAVPPSISTPDKVETQLGVLEFKDGVPNKATAEKLYDNLDFTYVFVCSWNNMRGVSVHALRSGMQSIGVNEVLAFSDLMDAKSLFLTANADTIYVMGYLDLTKGPVVLETPPKFLGAVQDAWFRWVISACPVQTVQLTPGSPWRGTGSCHLFVLVGGRRDFLAKTRGIPFCGICSEGCPSIELLQEQELNLGS